MGRRRKPQSSQKHTGSLLQTVTFIAKLPRTAGRVATSKKIIPMSPQRALIDTKYSLRTYPDTSRNSSHVKILLQNTYADRVKLFHRELHRTGMESTKKGQKNPFHHRLKSTETQQAAQSKCSLSTNQGRLVHRKSFTESEEIKEGIGDIFPTTQVVGTYPANC